MKTIIASPGKYTGPLHWDNRYFSIKEYKRLQGFPDDFQFAGNRASIIRQIGNAVSPHVARQLALAVANQIFCESNSVVLMETDRKLSFDRRKGDKAQKTRALHADVAGMELGSQQAHFVSKNYKVAIQPSEFSDDVLNAKCLSAPDKTRLIVRTDKTDAPFATMKLRIGNGAQPLTLVVEGFGQSPDTAQAMWNCVDDWVRRSSDFHSLFELYGHFTEPHPVFSVESFVTFSNHPVAYFSKHAAEFANCSRYFAKDHLVQLFGEVLGTKDFVQIAHYLRQYRFDIRSQETNVAIEPGKYMVAYPFTLPERRQMNFSVRQAHDAVQVAA